MIYCAYSAEASIAKQLNASGGGSDRPSRIDVEKEVRSWRTNFLRHFIVMKISYFMFDNIFPPRAFHREKAAKSKTKKKGTNQSIDLILRYFLPGSELTPHELMKRLVCRFFAYFYSTKKQILQQKVVVA